MSTDNKSTQSQAAKSTVGKDIPTPSELMKNAVTALDPKAKEENTNGVVNTPNLSSEVPNADSFKASVISNSSLKVPLQRKVVLECSIRRKLGMTGLPGLEESVRKYKLGSSLDVNTSKSLKGISGLLEQKIMPTLIGTSLNDNNFNSNVMDYWSSISVIIPEDETYQKDYEKGKLLKIEMIVKGDLLYDKLNKTSDIGEKVELIENGIIDDFIILNTESYSAFALLCFALKHKRVARRVEDVGNSPKIHFYIYNKQTAIANSLTKIELRAKATEIFSRIQEDEATLDAILIMFEKSPTDFSDIMEKVIEVDELYNKSISSMQKFVSYAEDKDLQTKYLIKLSVKLGKLLNPSNSESYYYNDILLGSTLQEAVLTLNSDVQDYRLIKQTLLRETKLLKQ